VIFVPEWPKGEFVSFPPISLVVFEKILQVLFRNDRKSTSGNYIFCIGNFDRFSLWTCLILPLILGLVLFFLPLKHVFIIFHLKKKFGERADFYSFF